MQRPSNASDSNPLVVKYQRPNPKKKLSIVQQTNDFHELSTIPNVPNPPVFIPQQNFARQDSPFSLKSTDDQQVDNTRQSSLFPNPVHQPTILKRTSESRSPTQIAINVIPGNKPPTPKETTSKPIPAKVTFEQKSIHNTLNPPGPLSVPQNLAVNDNKAIQPSPARASLLQTPPLQTATNKVQPINNDLVILKQVQSNMKPVGEGPIKTTIPVNATNARSSPNARKIIAKSNQLPKRKSDNSMTANAEKSDESTMDRFMKSSGMSILCIIIGIALIAGTIALVVVITQK